MKMAAAAFLLTIFLGFCGMIIDSNIELDGNFSVVVAIAVMGSFVVYSLNKHNEK